MSSEDDVDETKGTNGTKPGRTESAGGNDEEARAGKRSDGGERESSEDGSTAGRADQIACTERVLETTPEAAIVANLGVASYALASVADRARNFYCWGSMGLTSSIGLGLALAVDGQVTVFEGDGSLCMSLGVLSTVGACDPSNLVVVVWENGIYGTTGGQPINEVEYAAAARACGVKAMTAGTVAGFAERYAEAVAYNGAALLVCTVEPIDPDARPPLDFAFVARRFREALASDGSGGIDGTESTGATDGDER